MDGRGEVFGSFRSEASKYGGQEAVARSSHLAKDAAPSFKEFHSTPTHYSPYASGTREASARLLSQTEVTTTSTTSEGVSEPSSRGSRCVGARDQSSTELIDTPVDESSLSGISSSNGLDGLPCLVDKTLDFPSLQSPHVVVEPGKVDDWGSREQQETQTVKDACGLLLEGVSDTSTRVVRQVEETSNQPGGALTLGELIGQSGVAVPQLGNVFDRPSAFCAPDAHEMISQRPGSDSIGLLGSRIGEMGCQLGDSDPTDWFFRDSIVPEHQGSRQGLPARQRDVLDDFQADEFHPSPTPTGRPHLSDQTICPSQHQQGLVSLAPGEDHQIPPLSEQVEGIPEGATEVRAGGMSSDRRLSSDGSSCEHIPGTLTNISQPLVSQQDEGVVLNDAFDMLEQLLESVDGETDESEWPVFAGARQQQEAMGVGHLVQGIEDLGRADSSLHAAPPTSSPSLEQSAGRYTSDSEYCSTEEAEMGEVTGDPGPGSSPPWMFGASHMKSLQSLSQHPETHSWPYQSAEEQHAQRQMTKPEAAVPSQQVSGLFNDDLMSMFQSTVGVTGTVEGGEMASGGGGVRGRELEESAARAGGYPQQQIVTLLTSASPPRKRLLIPRATAKASLSTREQLRFTAPTSGGEGAVWLTTNPATRSLPQLQGQAPGQERPAARAQCSGPRDQGERLRVIAEAQKEPDLTGRLAAALRQIKSSRRVSPFQVSGEGVRQETAAGAGAGWQSGGGEGGMEHLPEVDNMKECLPTQQENQQLALLATPLGEWTELLRVQERAQVEQWLQVLESQPGMFEQLSTVATSRGGMEDVQARNTSARSDSQQDPPVPRMGNRRSEAQANTPADCAPQTTSPDVSPDSSLALPRPRRPRRRPVASDGTVRPLPITPASTSLFSKHQQQQQQQSSGVPTFVDSPFLRPPFAPSPSQGGLFGGMPPIVRSAPWDGPAQATFAAGNSVMVPRGLIGRRGHLLGSADLGEAPPDVLLDRLAQVAEAVATQDQVCRADAN